MYKILFLVGFLSVTLGLKAQVIDSSFVEID
jgi:hypothetical protein